MPTFNRARYLDRLLQDLSAHIGELGFSYELLIGDNASEDDTADVVRRYEDQLAIRYTRRPENVGGYHNLSQLIDAAHGRYVVYVGDDDLLIPGVLGRYIAYLEGHSDVGAVFAPWFFHDRITGRDFGQFYYVEQQTRIEAGDHAALFDFLVDGHVFPEIYVARTSFAQTLAGAANPFAFIFFVRVAAMVDRAAVTFSPEPFYRQVFDESSHTHLGHEEVKVGWDRYRGGLEHILARFASQLSGEDLDRCHRAIDRFVRIRMRVGLRLRTEEGKDWIDNYYIASRLRCVGDDSQLPAPYETYRINAALQYLLGLQPFLPEPATVAFYEDDPPRILTQARGFAAASLMALGDRSVPLPENIILLTSHAPAPANSATFVISEAELLSRFPGGPQDRDLLLPEIAPDAGGAQSVFNLAQSLFQAGDFVNARKWYARRAEMGGWDEEVYYSMFRVAQAMEHLGEAWPDVQDAYLKAWEFRPTRAEALHAIARRYREGQRYLLGHLFAQFAAQIPFPETDVLFVGADVYAWGAIDEQAVCAFWIGKHAEAFALCRRLVAHPDIPDERRRGVAANRDFSVPAMIEAASSYPGEVVDSLVAGPRDAEVTVSLVAGPDREVTEQTLNSFLHCCTDLSRVGCFVAVDVGLSVQDRAWLRKRYGFLRFAPRRSGDGPQAQVAQLSKRVGGRFWLHLGQGWRFFAPEDYITRLSAVFDAEPRVFQVGVNYGDAVKLTGTCAAEAEVRRAPDAGRYVLADVVASGPAMFDVARLDQAGGMSGTDPDPIAALERRIAAAGLQTASLDEVLCVTAT
ncbi:glycosyltransferase family A protein [Mycobacterium sp. 050134]|uniref:glycosyltransferase family A protein n=1 Tax=Mycobacterium sp. 050134 TaxID=3096111 RepID=UPI002EDB7AA5